MGKTRRQKDGCSFYQVKFTWAWITLYPCFLDLMYASVHYFLIKKRNLLFIANTFPSMIFPESTCAKLGGTMRFCLEINLNSNFDKIFHSINDITYLCFNIRHCLRGKVISQNFMYHQNSPHFVQKPCNNTLCDGYVSE
jgi:hypothetical protein